ncbi:MAG: argininosuccinate lyase, partial [bacterium]
LAELRLEEFRRFSLAFGPDIIEAIQTKNVVAARTSYGGTAPGQVERALQEGWALLAQKQGKPGP